MLAKQFIRRALYSFLLYECLEIGIAAYFIKMRLRACRFFDILRVQSYGFFQIRDGFFGLALVAVNRRDAVVAPRIVRFCVDYLLKILDGDVVLPIDFAG